MVAAIINYLHILILPSYFKPVFSKMCNMAVLDIYFKIQHCNILNHTVKIHFYSNFLYIKWRVSV